MKGGKREGGRGKGVVGKGMMGGRKGGGREGGIDGREEGRGGREGGIDGGGCCVHCPCHFDRVCHFLHYVS